jgi:hypothetical protein
MKKIKLTKGKWAIVDAIRTRLLAEKKYHKIIPNLLLGKEDGI